MNKLLGALLLSVFTYLILTQIINGFFCDEKHIFTICEESPVSKELLLFAVPFMFIVGWWLGYKEIIKQANASVGNCPYCGTKLPGFQIVRSLKQALRKTLVCEKCGKESTVRGEKV